MAAEHGGGGGREEVDEGKNTDIPSLPFPSLPSMEFYALRVFDAARTRGSRPHFQPSPPSPFWLTFTRYFDPRYTIGQHREMPTRVNVHTRLRMEKKKERKEKKITTEQTIRATWTTATNNVGLVGELSRQKLQLLRVLGAAEMDTMTRDKRENNC